MKRRIVEELCQEASCEQVGGTHWHPLSVESLLSEEDGEYTIIVRVRSIGGRRRRTK